MTGRVLVTGSDGFTGLYVVRALAARGYQPIEMDGPRSTGPAATNLLDHEALERFVEKHLPIDYVVHLAGQAFVAHENPAEQYEVNLIGSANLLRAIARVCPSVRKMILASSANVYGRPATLPAPESSPAAPLSDYGVSKYAMELMARTWFERLPILIVRPFNYTGVGQSERFVIAKVAKRLRDRIPEIEVGNTSVVREFNDVRDVADVYAQLLGSAAVSDVVNICSGVGHRLSSVIEAMVRLAGYDAKLRSTPTLQRYGEIMELVGSTVKLRSAAGRPQFRPLGDTLRWMLAP